MCALCRAAYHPSPQSGCGERDLSPVLAHFREAGGRPGGGYLEGPEVCRPVPQLVGNVCGENVS